jgi:chloramphenicol 3-O-phosphotransferase
MPRINVEATHELRAAQANAAYIEEHYPGYGVNDGWAVDCVSRVYTSKVYGVGVAVSTSMEPPYETTEGDL